MKWVIIGLSLIVILLLVHEWLEKSEEKKQDPNSLEWPWEDL
jgi:hypothetical protein